MRCRFGILVAVASMGAWLLTGAPASGGTLDFGPPGQPGIGDFSPVTLTGTPVLTSVSIDPFSVVDSTGSGSGWNVTLTISDLVHGGSVIPASSMKMPAPLVTAVDGASMTGVAGHATTGNLRSGEKIVTAAVGEGEGTYLVSPALLTLTVPPDAVVGNYVASASIAVVSGP
jgi:hypothetical protein